MHLCAQFPVHAAFVALSISGCGLILEPSLFDAGIEGELDAAAPIDAAAMPIDAAIPIDAAMPIDAAERSDTGVIPPDTGSSELDAGRRDAGRRDASAMTSDAGPSCNSGWIEIDLDQVEPTFNSGAYVDGCSQQTWVSTGRPSTGAPRITEAYAGSIAEGPVVYLAAMTYRMAGIDIIFDSPVSALSFGFEWLSFYPAMGYDERLEFWLDGVQVTPELSAAAGTRISSAQVVSSVGKGDGHITVRGFTRVSILLVNQGNSGEGIELHSFRYQY